MNSFLFRQVSRSKECLKTANLQKLFFTSGPVYLSSDVDHPLVTIDKQKPLFKSIRNFFLF